MSTITVGNLTIDPPTAGELCDSCAVAPALVKVVTKSFKTLTFCGHDFDKIAPEYREAAFLAHADARKP